MTVILVPNVSTLEDFPWRLCVGGSSSTCSADWLEAHGREETRLTDYREATMVMFVLRTATLSYPNQIEVEGNLVLSYPFQIRVFSKISLCNHELICSS